MKGVVLSLVLFCCTCLAQEPGKVRFAALDVYVNSAEPLAAWQFELSDRNGMMKIVGIENGASAAFGDAPYYDREAVQLGTADRIVVADFSLADEAELPSGEVRVATLHLMLSGDREPAYDLELVTATNYDGQVIDASIRLGETNGSDL